YVRTPTQCFQCHKLGHIAAHCHNKALCVKCSGTHDTRDCVSPEDCIAVPQTETIHDYI
ncbi:hypothetical protein CROQUDRAFT_50515, partial [Cronartium quercuum f. sp. fusiforme G11]